jgi:hypothetical protein
VAKLIAEMLRGDTSAFARAHELMERRRPAG